MQGCPYGKEPLDLKLLLLVMMKKILVILLAGILGALLCGGIYFLDKIAFGEGVTYEAVSTYYVDYGTDPLTNNEFTYINGATWNDIWVHSDEFVASILQKAGEEAARLTGVPLTAEKVRASVSAALETDLRMPITTVRTESPELTMALCRALEETMVEFGESGEQKEINGIRLVIGPKDAQKSVLDNRTGRACILGAVLGLFFAVVGLCLYYMLDDSVYVPETFEYRYGIPMLGTLSAKELGENFSYLFSGKMRIALVGTDEKTEPEEVLKDLRDALGTQGEEKEYMPVRAIDREPEGLETLRKADGVLLLIEAGAHDGKRIEHCLQLLRKQDIAVTAALLLHEDEKLLKAYYLPGTFLRHKGGRP